MNPHQSRGHPLFEYTGAYLIWGQHYCWFRALGFATRSKPSPLAARPGPDGISVVEVPERAIWEPQSRCKIERTMTLWPFRGVVFCRTPKMVVFLLVFGHFGMWLSIHVFLDSDPPKWWCSSWFSIKNVKKRGTLEKK